MRSREVGLIVALCIFVAPARACDVNLANETTNLILREIGNGTIDRVDVVSIPEEANTFRAISPQMMEWILARKHSIKLSKDDTPQLLVGITALKPKQEQGPTDLRWGFWFLDASGRRLHSLFFDSERWYSKGRRGYIDGNKCNFSSSLIHWARRRGM